MTPKDRKYRKNVLKRLQSAIKNFLSFFTFVLNSHKHWYSKQL